jgi:hypothetical protein
MLRGILLEGITGAGKSRTLAALQAQPDFPALLGAGRIFPEEETFGELMDELGEPGADPRWLCRRLGATLDTLRALPAGAQPVGYVLERFHLSYYALLPEWALYQSFDAALQALECGLVLLDYQEGEAERRSLDRPDRAAEGWRAGMVAHYGSLERALTAIAASRERRRACPALTALPTLILDTSAMTWDAYAARIIAFWRSGV